MVSGCCCKEVYRYLTIIINFPYSTCISSFWRSIPTSLFIFKMFFRVFFMLFLCNIANVVQKEHLRSFKNQDHTNILCRCYTLILLEISRRTRWWCLKCVIVYLARDIPPFVSGPSLLIESYFGVYRLNGNYTEELT